MNADDHSSQNTSLALTKSEARRLEEAMKGDYQHPASEQWEPLRQALDHLGPPDRLDSAPFLALRGLQHVARHLDGCRELPDDAKRHLAEYALACGNQLQRRVGQTPLRHVFARFSTFANEEVEAYVHGAARAHRPRAGSWKEDAVAVWNALKEEPAWASRPTRAHENSKVPTAGGSDEPEPDPQRSPVSEDVLSITADRSAALVGGDRNEQARRRLEKHFRFDELVWVEPGKPREVQRVVRQMENGTIDLAIIIVQLTSHGACDAFRGASGPSVMVTGGYGTTRIAAAIREQIPGTL